MENEYNKKVYQETTLPLNVKALAAIKIKPTAAATAAAITNSTKCNTETTTTTTAAPTTTTSTPTSKGKAKRFPHYYNRNDKSDLGQNFIAPDGGWAWLVCIAAGLSNLSIYPCLQQFGFIFRERLIVLGMTSSQITTIINTNPAVSACTGLLNGPMFRRFTFRQVAIAGSLFIFGGIVLTAFCETFIGYMITYALLLGFGMGISVSASSLAINTYFENRRRRAAGFSWTITGLGPIFLPYFVTFLLTIYGVQGTVLIFAALSLHSFVCALIYQPVYYHTRPPVADDLKEGLASGGSDSIGDNNNGNDAAKMQPEYLCKYCTLREKRDKGGIFSSQYLCQDDDVDRPGFEIIEPGTPMLSRANDGWFGSRMSLASGKLHFRTISSSKDLEMTNRLNHVISEEDEMLQSNEFFKPNNFSRERDEQQQRNRSIRRHLSNACDFEGRHPYCTCAEEKALLEYHRLQRQRMYDAGDYADDDDVGKIIGTAYGARNSDLAELELQKQQLNMSFIEKVVTFFDLDLLRDFTFVNLVIGLTIINFGELNFSILTPFILTDFGFDTSQITLAMSTLAGLDITMRFLVPFLTEKIPWDNRVFFLIGVVGIALGRTVVACTRSYPIILSSFVWIGLCKGVRTIFWPLVIPGYIPLNRLPAASGLQLLISGIFTLLAGPFVGLVRDRFDYSVTLHCLNTMTFIAAISWTLEALIRRRRRRTHD